jgi:hypothetical protein
LVSEINTGIALNGLINEKSEINEEIKRVVIKFGAKVAILYRWIS